MNLAEQIVVGSREIGRMKNEILIVINTITGLIDESDKTSGNVRIRFEVGTNEWSYESWPKQRNDTGLIVRSFCTDVAAKDAFQMRVRMICYGTHENFRLRYEDAESVYRELDAFVDGMMNAIPSLKTKLKPLLDAANASYRFD